MFKVSIIILFLIHLNTNFKNKIYFLGKTKLKSDINNEFKKQLIWFQANYIKIERENQKFWINYHQSHLKNLEKFVFFISVFIKIF